MKGEIRLDLGCGDNPQPGYIGVDRKLGSEVYPLDYEDGTVDEIRASHVLEHFSHQHAATVLKHWVGKLKVGGKISIAVPDFERIASWYLNGEAIPVQSYTMGGHVDDNDRHGAIYDKEALTELMLDAGLDGIHPWRSRADDCASLPVSLNLAGFKRDDKVDWSKMGESVFGVMSAPREGPLIHAACVYDAIAKTGIKYNQAQGVFWHQILTNCIEDRIQENPGRYEYVLTFDYDTVFRPTDLYELWLTAKRTDADAIFPLQSKRSAQHALFTVKDKNGKFKTKIDHADLNRNVLPANSGHFGMTLIKIEKLMQLARPWFNDQPNSEGCWREGKVDADSSFWLKWREAGNSLFLAPRVRVGHFERFVTYPDDNLQPIHMKVSDWNEYGPPDTTPAIDKIVADVRKLSQSAAMLLQRLDHD